MGRNIYGYKKSQKEDIELIKALLDQGDLGTAKEKLDFAISENRIHIGKFSSGWVFCFDHNDKQWKSIEDYKSGFQPTNFGLNTVIQFLSRSFGKMLNPDKVIKEVFRDSTKTTISISMVTNLVTKAIFRRLLQTLLAIAGFLFLQTLCKCFRQPVTKTGN